MPPPPHSAVGYFRLTHRCKASFALPQIDYTLP